MNVTGSSCSAAVGFACPVCRAVEFAASSLISVHWLVWYLDVSAQGYLLRSRSDNEYRSG
jgi:hypothetical protein